MQVNSGGPSAKRRWTAGRLELMVPGRSTVRSYAATSALSTVQVHIPQAVIRQTATQLGRREPDFEAMPAGLGKADPVVEHLLRSLPAQREAGDVYAESAAAVPAVHLLSRGREPRRCGQ